MTQTQPTTHTAGPWHYRRVDPLSDHDRGPKALPYPVLRIYGQQSGLTRVVADVDIEHLGETYAEVIARLIAAAPELLAALELVRNAPWAKSDVEIVTYLIELCAQNGAVRAAIAHARGQS